MKKIRIAQIGMNRHSHAGSVFHSLTKYPDIFEIAGYTLVEDEREISERKLKVFNGFRELTLDEILNDPTIEAVTVETDEIHLTKYATLAALHGKHIHMEKPGSPSLEDFEKLIETVKTGGKVFHIGYMYRYNPFVIDLMEKVRSGALGEITSVEAQMNCWHDVSLRNWLSDFPGGMMFFLGCHLVDLVYQIQGRPERIIPLNKNTGIDGSVGSDFGMAIFEYKNGVSFAKASACEVGGYLRRQLVVSGSKGTIELKPFEVPVPKTNFDIYTDKVECTPGFDWHHPGETSRCEPFDRYDGMILAFAKMVRGDIINPYTYDYELELFKILLECCGE